MFRENVKKVLAFGVALIMIALVVTGCGGNDTGSGNDNAGGTNDAGSGETTGGGAEGGNRDQVVVAVSANPQSLDLHMTNDNPSAIVTRQIFETLVHQDEDMVLHPGLATDWRQIDEYTWEFDIRQGVTFHNGDEMTAEDVAFSIRRGSNVTARPMVSPILGMIDEDSIEVLEDGQTVRIGTLIPFAPLPNHLAHVAAGIMSERAVAESEDTERNPVGTGPFRFVNWLNEDYVELARFDDYHGDLPQFESLLMRVIVENSSRIVELEAGTVDIIMNPGAENFARVEDHPELNLLATQGLQTNHMGMNVNHEHLGNRLVRQAMNYAVNMEEIREAIAFGHGGIATGPITPMVFGFDSDSVGYPFNLERAQELMREAGLEDGFDMYLYVPNAQANIDLAAVIQAQVAAINVRVEIEPLEWSAFTAAADEGVDAFMMGWGAITGDADYGIFPLFHTSQHGSAGNRTFFSNERVDELLDAGRSTADPAERLEIYREVQEIIVYEAPWIFMLQPLASLGARSNIQGLRVNPTNAHDFSGVYFE